MVAEPYRKKEPHPFAVANLLKPASYVSLQSALAHYGCIPEHVPTVTSVTTGRPETLQTPFGGYSYRHLHQRLFFGYQAVAVPGGTSVFLATPEKALLDLIHLTPRGDAIAFLEELRLDGAETLDPQRLLKLADLMGSARVQRAAQIVARLL
jgi:predicted transcriptional regulator of viral defense system